MRIGPVELSAVKDWDPAPGVLVSWHPTPASCAKALAAPVSAVPPSYVQARQIRSFSEQAARGSITRGCSLRPLRCLVTAICAP